MRLPDGTSVEVVGLENQNGAIKAIFEVLWPDGLQAKSFIVFRATVSATAGPIGVNAVSLGGLVPAKP